MVKMALDLERFIEPDEFEQYGIDPAKTKVTVEADSTRDGVFDIEIDKGNIDVYALPRGVQESIACALWERARDEAEWY